VRRILVRVPNWVGDAVMALPALAGVRGLFPRAEITVLAAPRVAPLFPGQPGVSEVLVYPSGWEKWLTLWRLRRGLRCPVAQDFAGALPGNRKPETGNRAFDLGLAFPNSFESALGLVLAGAKERLGYNTDARGPLLSIRVEGAKGLKNLHLVYYYLGVLQACGGVEAFSPPRLYLRDQEVEDAASLLYPLPKTSKELKISGDHPLTPALSSPGERGGKREERLIANGIKADVGEGPWVGLAPGAAYGPAKRWPPERFAALGRELLGEFRARLVLLGGPEDRDTAGQVQALLPQALNLAGMTGLREALGVLRHLRLLVTNDSGLMHAAAALGTPLVAIFGSTDPGATGPFTSRAAVLRHPRPCSPCLQRTCDQDYQCLLDISVAEVLNAARAWLQGDS
jgi:heptosyltransferase-2